MVSIIFYTNLHNVFCNLQIDLLLYDRAMIHPADTSNLTAEAILSVPLTEPEPVFPDPARLHHQWRSLAARWHPDRNSPESPATEVFQHINALYAMARNKAAAGEWAKPGVLRLTAIDGRCYELRYRRRTAFELGEVFIGSRTLVYAVNAADLDLYQAAIGAIGGLSSADAPMRQEMAGRLPVIKAAVNTADRSFLILRKDPDIVALSDLMGYLGGKLDPRHAAWIVSGLESIACYLDWAGIMHGAIAPETVFVSPRRHSVALLGGWWYVKAFGQAIKAIPERTARLMPPMLAARPMADLADQIPSRPARSASLGRSKLRPCQLAPVPGRQRAYSPLPRGRPDLRHRAYPRAAEAAAFDPAGGRRRRNRQARVARSGCQGRNHAGIGPEQPK